MTYSEAQQALAVEIVSRYDGQVTSECLAEVRQMLGVMSLPKVTVWRWFQNNVTDKKSVTPEARQQAAKRLDEMFESLARHALEAADSGDKFEKMNAQQLAMTAAIAVDKMRLLRDLPTEIVAVLPALMTAFERKGLNASDVFQSMLNKLAEDADVTQE